MMDANPHIRLRRLPPIDHAWIDSSESPLYVWRFPKSATDEEVTETCLARERWAEVARGEVAWVVDLTHVISAGASQRQILGDHLKRFEAHDLAFNQGSAIVVPNPILRGIVTAVFWISPPKFPNRPFGDLASARAWAQARLELAVTAPLP